MIIKRRNFLKYLALGGLTIGTTSGMAGYSYVQAEKVKSNAHIVVVGAGTGGLTTAAKLAERIDGGRITIIDKKETHHYQPGFTFIGCGIYRPEQVVKNNGDYIPANTRWVKRMVKEYNPEANAVVTDKGEKIPYDFLVVAPGIQLNYSAIEGMDVTMIGKNGIGSIYPGPEKALATYVEIQRFLKKGGCGLFTNPGTPIKCGGGPLKTTFLTHSLSHKTGRQKKVEFLYFTGKNNLFGVPEIDQLSKIRYKQKGIRPYYRHTLTAIDSIKKVAYFKTSEETREFSYDFIHVVPPMSAPDTVKNSLLSRRDGTGYGWLAVDKFTLQHHKYPNVFGVGDVVGTPLGKTAASIKFQAPIVADNIVSLIKGRELKAAYNGYTSCILFTQIGCGAVVEFDYDKKLIPTLPIINPKNDNWFGWYLDIYFIEPLYFQMIQGRVPA